MSELQADEPDVKLKLTLGEKGRPQTTVIGSVSLEVKRALVVPVPIATG